MSSESESASEREGLGRRNGSVVGEADLRGCFGGSAPELRLIVDDTIKDGTVFSGNAAKFGHVVGGVVMVDGHKGLNEGGYRVCVVCTLPTKSFIRISMSQSLSS